MPIHWRKSINNYGCCFQTSSLNLTFYYQPAFSKQDLAVLLLDIAEYSHICNTRPVSHYYVDNYLPISGRWSLVTYYRTGYLNTFARQGSPTSFDSVLTSKRGREYDYSRTSVLLSSVFLDLGYANDLFHISTVVRSNISYNCSHASSFIP